MGSHDTDEQYILYSGIYVLINILAWWWPAGSKLVAIIEINKE